MTEHAELLKKARELADRVEPDLMRSGEVDMAIAPRQDTCKEAAMTIRTLADIVEQQDAQLAKAVKVSDHAELLEEARELEESLPESTIRECRTVTVLSALADVVESHDKSESKLLSEEFMVLLDAQDKLILELLAACKTCGEVIRVFIAKYPDSEKDQWARLGAAGHLAKRAAEDGDKAKGGV